MSRDIIFEDCLTCGCSVELSLLENHVSNCIILNERSVSEVQRRKKLDVDVKKVKQYLDERIPTKEICRLLGISRRTLFRVLKEINITARPKYTKIGTKNLESYLTNTIFKRNPKFGYQMFKGATIANNVLLSNKRLKQSYRTIRQRQNAPLMQRIHRRVYKVRAPLSLWHIDGHHKLDRYSFIIHGAIDGFSRLIVYISLENNNCSETVIGLFEKGVEEWGYPASVRSDLGGENVLVADFMINARGVGKNAFRTGKSVHNQRVERLWKDVIERCTITFMDIFGEMETEGVLDVDSNLDLFCLHIVATNLIQRSLQTFKDSWNCHPLRTENHRSPMQLYHDGLQHLKTQQDNGAIEGEVTELIQGQKLKPISKWSGYKDTFFRCVIDQFGVNISEEELLCIVDLINPATIEIWNVKKKFIQVKQFVLQNFDD